MTKICKNYYYLWKTGSPGYFKTTRAEWQYRNTKSSQTMYFELNIAGGVIYVSRISNEQAH